jgi:hypothetical protein
MECQVLVSIAINGAFLLGLLTAIFATFRFGTRVERLAFVVGVTVATVLAAGWEGMGGLHLSSSTYYTLSRLTRLIWPSSFMMLDTDPMAQGNLDVLAGYCIAIAVNGVCYAFAGMIIRKVWGVGNKARA